MAVDRAHHDLALPAGADPLHPDGTVAGRQLRELATHQLDAEDATLVAGAADLVDDLVGLVAHLDLHSAYPFGGYAKMTRAQKALFRTVTNWDDRGPPAFDTPTGYLE